MNWTWLLHKAQAADMNVGFDCKLVPVHIRVVFDWSALGITGHYTGYLKVN